ncbi:MAG: hypothetical protein RI897_4273 [Verrucomicrobiota bacterium]
MVTNSSDVLVLGAGITGLLAAQHLQSQGLTVKVVDKARGVGGRMATRRSDHGTFDHGAQYFSTQNPAFRALVEKWAHAGVAQHWSDGFHLQTGEPRSTDLPRYRGAPSMTAIPKLLAKELDIALKTKATAIRPTGQGWTINTEQADPLHARSLILTAPVPQALTLLNAGQTQLPDDIRLCLERIQYAPCLALMVSLPLPSKLPTPGGMWFQQEPLAWMADNTTKGVSTAPGSAVTIHAAPDFSSRHWETPEEEVTTLLLNAASPWLGSHPLHTQLHRWRYSHPLHTHPTPCLALRQPKPVVFAGDAFGGAKVEGAALSGLAAARELHSILLKP